ncbi:MAG TPA: hypothetical protein V6C97_12110 [Oculatellaceae cyanobacterium]
MPIPSLSAVLPRNLRETISHEAQNLRITKITTTAKKPTRYTYPSYKGTISASEFRKLPKDAKLDVMRTWFFERYEDPVHSSPWVDGEYVYIHGGPYDAGVEIEAEFSGLASKEAIEELVDDLNSDCTEWTGAQDRADYDDYDDEYEWHRLSSSKEAFNSFEESVNATLALLKHNQAGDQHYLRLLYVSVITALETYLSDFFINIVKSERGYLQVFVEKFEPFENQKFARNKIFSEMAQIEKTALTALRELMWHDLAKISAIYKATLEIEFPKIAELYRAVSARHDFVHRSGKTPDGKKLTLEPVQVENVINQARMLVSSIEKQWDDKFKSSLAEIEDLL